MLSNDKMQQKDKEVMLEKIEQNKYAEVKSDRKYCMFYPLEDNRNSKENYSYFDEIKHAWDILLIVILVFFSL